jgi:GNAT superfamily N-acetyltransferase
MTVPAPGAARQHVVFREARLSDASAIVGAFDWLFAAPGSLPEGWNPAVAEDRTDSVIAGVGSTVLVAETSDELVGFCSVALDLPSIRFGQRAWIEDLAVHPAYRSAGIGKALLDMAKDWSRGQGADHLELDSGLDRKDAHRFYRREEPSWESICFGWVL